MEKRFFTGLLFAGALLVTGCSQDQDITYTLQNSCSHEIAVQYSTHAAGDTSFTELLPGEKLTLLNTTNPSGHVNWYDDYQLNIMYVFDHHGAPTRFNPNVAAYWIYHQDANHHTYDLYIHDEDF